MRDAARADIPTLVPLINDAYWPRDGWLFGEQRRIDREALAVELAGRWHDRHRRRVDGATAGFAVVRLAAITRSSACWRRRYSSRAAAWRG
jgi:hypothetical protein